MTESSPDRASDRLPAIDIIRGLVMVLMTLDHSSSAFNAHRSTADSAMTFRPETVLEPLHFIVRWVTHLCAPTFVFLAGTSLALSVMRRQRDGMASWLIDRDILIRGGLLIVLDVVWMSWMWRLGTPLQLGVIYAIGMSMLALIVLRRLPPAVVGALGVFVMVAGESLFLRLHPTSHLIAATLTGGQVGGIYHLYPFLPWVGFIMMGWAIGCQLATRGMRARDWLILAGIAAVMFVAVRGLNGYGNAELLRRDGYVSWMEWLHVSKYPPSWAYTTLELGISFTLMAAAWRWSARGAAAAGGYAAWSRGWPQQLLLVLGQTALFYYLLHAHIFKGVAVAFGVHKSLGLGTVFIGWIAMMALLYPACRWYLGVKRRNPNSLLRYI